MQSAATETSDPILVSRNTWTEGMKAADLVKIGSVFCDDVVMMPPNETSLYGKDEALEWYQEYYEYFRMTVFNGTERDVRIIGDQAIELWTYMVAIDPVRGGDRIRDDGRSLTVWRRDDRPVSFEHNDKFVFARKIPRARQCPPSAPAGHQWHVVPFEQAPDVA